MANTGSEDTIQAFVRAWNVEDDEERRRLVEQAWARDGVLLHPPGILNGQEELLAYIASEVSEWEGGKVRISKVNADSVPGHFLYAWAIFRPDGSIYGQGIHAGELAGDGRIRRIVNFLGEPPRVQ